MRSAKCQNSSLCRLVFFWLLGVIVPCLFCPANVAAQAAIPGEGPSVSSAQTDTPGFTVIAVDLENQTVTVVNQAGRETSLSRHQKVGPWALMAVVDEANERLAVFENVEDYLAKSLIAPLRVRWSRRQAPRNGNGIDCGPVPWPGRARRRPV